MHNGSHVAVGTNGTIILFVYHVTRGRLELRFIAIFHCTKPWVGSDEMLRVQQVPDHEE